jgi:hypothetical protein
MESMRMTRRSPSYVAAALAIAVAGAACGWWADATAQDSKKSRIFCWKYKTGKTVGCGDKVPPEYQDSATREMDARGVTRGTTESAEEAARRRAQEQETAKVRAEDARKAADQKRQDTALLNTFTSDKEIDQKRDRDLQQADNQMNQVKTSLKNATDRYDEVKARSDTAAKDKKGPSDALKDELTKATSEKQRFEQMVTAKEKEKEEITRRYAEQKKRYLELRGEAPAPTPASAKQAGTK